MHGLYPPYILRMDAANLRYICMAYTPPYILRMDAANLRYTRDTAGDRCLFVCSFLHPLFVVLEYAVLPHPRATWCQA